MGIGIYRVGGSIGHVVGSIGRLEIDIYRLVEGIEHVEIGIYRVDGGIGHVVGSI